MNGQHEQNGPFGAALGAISNKNPFTGVSKDPLAQRGLTGAQTKPQSPPPTPTTLVGLIDAFALAFNSLVQVNMQAEGIAGKLGLAFAPLGNSSDDVDPAAVVPYLHAQFGRLHREFAQMRDVLNAISNEIGG